MAKAQVTLPSGAKVTVEGTEDEVARLVLLLGDEESDQPKAAKGKKPAKAKSNPTVTDLINELIESGLLKKPTELGVIKKALEQQGHYYSNPTVATALLRLVKKRTLRRIKQEGQWRYVG